MLTPNELIFTFGDFYYGYDEAGQNCHYFNTNFNFQIRSNANSNANAALMA